MNPDKIGKFIRQQRLAKGLTQKELGSALYVTAKAVSKWERGLSIPDIALLDKLAEILDTDIYAILQIRKKTNSNLESILNEERMNLKKQATKRFMILLSITMIIILFILFEFLPFGYKIQTLKYKDKIVTLGIPEYSFAMHKLDNNYSYKNFRNNHVLKTEIKNYLNYLEHINCRDTTYYYDPITDITIINYDVKNYLFYNTVSYDIRNGNYCRELLIEEYEEHLGDFAKGLHYISPDKNLIIYFRPVYNQSTDQFEATLIVKTYDSKSKLMTTLESSIGTYEIKNNKLIYTRSEIKESQILINPVTNFLIKKKKLILYDNYLKDYAVDIILE